MARRSLAASVVVTISLADLGCTPTKQNEQVLETRNPPGRELEERPIIGNPPEPPPDEVPMPDPDGPPDSTPDAQALSAGDAKDEGVGTTQERPPENLPKPDELANVTRRSDGTCWEHFDMECPEGAMCNPPPPHQVECPPEPDTPGESK